MHEKTHTPQWKIRKKKEAHIESLQKQRDAAIAADQLADQHLKNAHAESDTEDDGDVSEEELTITPGAVRHNHPRTTLLLLSHELQHITDNIARWNPMRPYYPYYV
jgi:hypothetical protein